MHWPGLAQQQAASACTAICLKPWVLATPPPLFHANRPEVALSRRVQGSKLASPSCIRVMTSMVVTIQGHQARSVCLLGTLNWEVKAAVPQQCLTLHVPMSPNPKLISVAAGHPQPGG